MYPKNGIDATYLLIKWFRPQCRFFSFSFSPSGCFSITFSSTSFVSTSSAFLLLGHSGFGQVSDVKLPPITVFISSLITNDRDWKVVELVSPKYDGQYTHFKVSVCSQAVQYITSRIHMLALAWVMFLITISSSVDKKSLFRKNIVGGTSWHWALEFIVPLLWCTMRDGSWRGYWLKFDSLVAIGKQCGGPLCRTRNKILNQWIDIRQY